MAFIKINGIEMPCPTSYSWGEQDISDEDAGRTEDGKMHKNIVASKVKIELEWQNITPADANKILNAMRYESNGKMLPKEDFSVTYVDVCNGSPPNYLVTKTFYVGDRSSPVTWWAKDNRKVLTVSFNLVEV